MDEQRIIKERELKDNRINAHPGGAVQEEAYMDSSRPNRHQQKLSKNAYAEQLEADQREQRRLKDAERQQRGEEEIRKGLRNWQTC